MFVYIMNKSWLVNYLAGYIAQTMWRHGMVVVVVGAGVPKISQHSNEWSSRNFHSLDRLMCVREVKDDIKRLSLVV